MLLAIVLATRPPAESADGIDHPPLQWLTSLAQNAPALSREAPVLLFTSEDAESKLIAPHLSSLPSKPLVRSFESALRLENSTLNVHGLPEKVRCIGAASFAQVTDVIRYSSIWRSLKRAYGARLALEEWSAAHVLVTDTDGFVWKPVDAKAIVAHAQLTRYADHRGRAHAAASERPPRPDTNFRARAFCSLAPWVATLKSTAWDAHAARFAIGRDWAAWEAVVDELDLLPGPDVDLADDPMLVVESNAFMSMWSAVESHWRSQFAEAVLVSLTTPDSLYKHCVRGDVNFLEITYRAWLYRHHRRHRHLFVNSTALIEATLPLGARPLGFSYKPALLPSAIDAKWFHAAPSGLSRLWLHAVGDGEAAAEAARALRTLYEGSPPLVAFRHAFDGQAWANATGRACQAIELLQEMRAPAAALQLSSGAPPASLWHDCGLASSLSRVIGGQGGASTKVDEGQPPERPRYARHSGEWEPGY